MEQYYLKTAHRSPPTPSYTVPGTNKYILLALYVTKRNTFTP